jgi:hypothetical protein
MKGRKKFIIRCSKCDKDVAGFNEEHAKINFYIHEQTSKKHKDIWLRKKEMLVKSPHYRDLFLDAIKNKNDYVDGGIKMKQFFVKQIFSDLTLDEIDEMIKHADKVLKKDM